MSSDGDKEPPMSEEDIAKQVEEKCWNAFKEFDKEGSGQIASDEVKLVIEKMGVKMGEDEIFKMISDVDPDNTGKILYSDMKTRIVQRECERLGGSDETELLDAFVAMGGEDDGGGCVDAKKLIYTIKEEF